MSSGVGGIVGNLLGAKTAQYFEPRVKSAYFLIPAAFTVPASFFFLLTINETSNLGAVYFYIFMSMIFVWTFIGPLAAVVIGVIPPPLRSLAGGLAHLIVSILGNIISPPIIGAVSDDSGSLRTGMQSIWITTLVSGILWFCGYKFLPALTSDLGETNSGNKSDKETVTLSEFLWKGGIAAKRNMKTEVTIEVDNPMVEHGSEMDAANSREDEAAVKKPAAPSSNRRVPQSLSRAEDPDTSNPMHNGSASKNAVAAAGDSASSGNREGETAANAAAAAPHSNRRVVSAALTRSDAAPKENSPEFNPTSDRASNKRTAGSRPVEETPSERPAAVLSDSQPQSNRRLLAGREADAAVSTEVSLRASPAESAAPVSNRRVVPSSLSSTAVPAATLSPEAVKAAEGSRPSSINRKSSERGDLSSGTGDNSNNNSRSGRANGPPAVSSSPAPDPRPTSSGRRANGNFSSDSAAASAPGSGGASSASKASANAQATPKRASREVSVVASVPVAPGSSSKKPASISPVKSTPPVSDLDTWC